MKAKKSKVKEKTITDKSYNRLGGKSYYIRNMTNSMYLDSNVVGDVYYSENNYQRWEISPTETANYFLLKYIPTGLYLTSNEIGEIFTALSDSSTYQKWIIYETNEKEIYAYANAGNNFMLSCNSMEQVLLKNEKPVNGFFYTFQNFPKK